MVAQQAEKGSIQVIERMMSLLDVLADSPEPASLKILAQTTGLHPSTAHRILAAMTATRLVERQDAGTYQLGIRHDDEIIYAERTSSGRSLVRVVYLVGGRAPLHLTSVGKLFLAADTPENVRAYAKRTGLPGKTPHSLTSLTALEKELDKIRRHGLAFDNEEAEIGLRCVAAPLRNDEGIIVAGLSVSAPTDRHSPEWVAQVKETAEQISQALGYRKARK